MFMFIINKLKNKTQKLQQTSTYSDAVSVCLSIKIELKYSIPKVYLLPIGYFFLMNINVTTH